MVYFPTFAFFHICIILSFRVHNFLQTSRSAYLLFVTGKNIDTLMIKSRDYLKRLRNGVKREGVPHIFDCLLSWLFEGMDGCVRRFGCSVSSNA